MRTARQQQLHRLLAQCNSDSAYAGHEVAVNVLERLAAYGLGGAPLRTWAQTLFCQVHFGTETKGCDDDCMFHACTLRCLLCAHANIATVVLLSLLDALHCI